MKAKHVVKIIEIGVTAIVSLAVGLFGGQNLGKTTIINNIVANGSTVDKEGSPDEIAAVISERLTQNQDEIAQISKEKEEAESQLEDANSKISELEKENDDLLRQIDNEIKVEYSDSKLYLDGGALSELSNPILLVDENSFFSESALKTVLGHYGIAYEYVENEVCIGEKKVIDKVPLSQAEIYEKARGSSLNSGNRKDMNGNEFCGILIENDTTSGRISFFTNEKYEKISGVVHVTAESTNHNTSKIKIRKIDKYENVVTVYTSPEMTNLSDPAYFTDVDISGAKLVTIEQDYETGGTVEFVISEAYFYNE